MAQLFSWLWLVGSVSAPFTLQSAVLKEFDFLMEVSRPGPLVIPSAPPTIELPPEQVVPPSPQPVVEFPEDEVQLCIIVVCGFKLIALTFVVHIIFKRFVLPTVAEGLV